MGSPRRAPLSQSSLYSNWSVNSSWSQSSRLGPAEDFWVRLPESPKQRCRGRPPRPPSAESQGSRRPPRLPTLGRSRSNSRGSDRNGNQDQNQDVHSVSRHSFSRHSVSRHSVSSQGARPKKQRRPASQQQRTREEPKEWTTPPLRELIPGEVRSKVLGLAGKGSALIIEMLWSTSAYLPAHNGGLKYKEVASNLKELMEGRISRGFPLPVLTIDEPVPIKKRVAGIYDRYSEWERSFGLVASNSSYSYAAPSRVGAFEVHLVQGSWDAQLCAAGPLPKDQTHRGPPVSGSLGILCSACALRHSEGAPSQKEQRMSSEQAKEYEKQMQQQHSLLHSKLWTRRWPGLRFLVGRIGAILIRPVPDVARPVSMRKVDFKKRSSPLLERFNFAFNRKAISLPPDPVQAIRQELAALDCPAAKGWFITVDEGPEILCRCGGGSHRLEVAQVLGILQSLGFDDSAFHSFCLAQKGSWKGQGVNEFIAHFLKLEMQHTLDQKQEEHARETSRRKAQEELAYQHLNMTQQGHLTEQDEICKEYKKSFEDSHAEAERIYVTLCLFLVRRLPSHGFDLRRLDSGEATAEEAAQVVAEALKLNDERRQKWSGWYQEVESWKRNDSEEELAIFESILSQRPDIAEMLAYKENEEQRLEQGIQSFELKMHQAYPKPEFYQGRINNLKDTFLRLLADYHQTVAGEASR